MISNAVRIAKERGLQVALDLASFNIVEENLGFLHDLVDRHVDILFANEQEAAAFTGEKSPLEALDKIARKCSIAVVKVGTRGAYVKYRGRVDHIGIMGNARRVDSTGAGDFTPPDSCSDCAGDCRWNSAARSAPSPPER